MRQEPKTRKWAPCCRACGAELGASYLECAHCDARLCRDDDRPWKCFLKHCAVVGRDDDHRERVAEVRQVGPLAAGDGARVAELVAAGELAAAERCAVCGAEPTTPYTIGLEGTPTASLCQAHGRSWTEMVALFRVPQ